MTFCKLIVASTPLILDLNVFNETESLSFKSFIIFHAEGSENMSALFLAGP